MDFEAKVIADSICNGQRLTTIQCTFPRIILAEWNTHCMFARNTSSSRAIPFKKMLLQVLDSPFIPIYWGINQSGMQAKVELTGKKREQAIERWLVARNNAVTVAKQMASEQCWKCYGEGSVLDVALLGDMPLTHECPACGGDGLGLNIHKQIVNRLVEPWMWTTNCTTADWGGWSNFMALRCHEDAEPHMSKIAYMMQLAYFRSTPRECQPGDWHMPYTQSDDLQWLSNMLGVDDTVKVSVGRCARTSYLTQEGVRDYQADIALHEKLRNHTPLHASPFEHVCQAMDESCYACKGHRFIGITPCWECRSTGYRRYAKYVGWKSYRHMIPREYVIDFRPNHPELIGEQVNAKERSCSR